MSKYPDIEVKLIGQDGNAFAILGAVMKALRRAGLDEKVAQEYYTEATSGDYDNLLAVTDNWVEIY